MDGSSDVCSADLFEGVADGIDATTAILTGLPGAVIEKNRDAALLSPSALLDASLGRSVALVRTNPATGVRDSVSGTIRSDRSEEHTSELQSLMRISSAVFCLKKNKIIQYRSNMHS